MAEHKHWKSDSNSKFLGSQDLMSDGKDIVVQIRDVVIEPVFNPASKSTDEKRVLYFEGSVKPMICNEVNSKSIDKVVGSGFYDEWVGKKIQIYVAPEPRSATGFALRIREFPPQV